MNNDTAHLLYDYLIKTGISESIARYLNLIGLLLTTLIVVGILHFVIKKVIRRVSVLFARRTKTNLDDIAITNKLPRLLAHVFPLLLAIELIPVVFADFDYLAGIALKFVNILAIILILNIVKSILRSLRDHLKTLPRFQDKPIDSYIQVFMIIGWIMAILTIFAIITDTSIWKFFTALGAASAVLLL